MQIRFYSKYSKSFFRSCNNILKIKYLLHNYFTGANVFVDYFMNLEFGTARQSDL